MNEEEVDRALRAHWQAPPDPPAHLRRDLIAATEPPPRPRWLPRFAFATATVMAVGLAWWMPHHAATPPTDNSSALTLDDADSEATEDTALFDIATAAAD